jgi:ABC-type multidrug transport system ATPase subunit
MKPVLQVSSLGFRFGARSVFHDFSLTLDAGITWLRGPNGKGKTTLLRLMAGALDPHAGHITLDSVDSKATPLAYRLSSFFCGGDLPDLPWLTVQEFLDIHMALYPALVAADVNAQLQAFGIGEVLPQLLSTLSLGQHKKVQLALALALPVRLLLVDEPFNGLDTAALDYLRGALAARGASGEVCVVLTSHLDPALALARTLDLP